MRSATDGWPFRSSPSTIPMSRHNSVGGWPSGGRTRTSRSWIVSRGSTRARSSPCATTRISAWCSSSTSSGSGSPGCPSRTSPPDVRSALAAALLVALVLGAFSPAWAAGGSSTEQAPHWVVAEVREVDRIQKRLMLSDGSEVWATDVRQLDQLTEGIKVKVRIETRGGRRYIYSIEKL